MPDTRIATACRVDTMAHTTVGPGWRWVVMLGMLGAIYVAAGTATSAALLFAAAVATGESIPWPGARDLGLLLLLGVGAHVGGWVAISRGMTAVPAATGSLLLLLQPVLATIWGVVVFAEPFGGYEVSGTLLSLGAIYAAMLTRAPAGR